MEGPAKVTVEELGDAGQFWELISSWIRMLDVDGWVLKGVDIWVGHFPKIVKFL